MIWSHLSVLTHRIPFPRSSSLSLFGEMEKQQDGATMNQKKSLTKRSCCFSETSFKYKRATNYVCDLFFNKVRTTTTE